MNLPSRVILVDDDKTSNLLSRYAVKKLFPDMEVHEFINPEKALEFIEEEYVEGKSLPTFMLLDINMPEMSGWQFLDSYEKFDKNVHSQFTINMLSSSVSPDDMEMANTNVHVSGFCSKPMKLETLKELFAN